MIKIGIVGCGTIGSEIARTLVKKHSDRARIVALSDIDQDKAKALKDELGISAEALDTEWLLASSDLIIEAAGIEAARELIPKALKLKKDIMVMSTGALIDFDDKILRSHQLHYPSGAIAGLDGVKSASQANIDKITLTTRKPPAGLGLKDIKEETVVFEGTLPEAIKAYPKNINVGATLSISLAKKFRSKLKVRIITAPEYTTNSHEVELSGEFGKLRAKTENQPSKTNPKTSALAIFSALSKIEEIIY